MKWVYCHLGLGDAILTNGLVRELVKRHGPITTFAKPHNLASVRFMYRDIPVTVEEADDIKAQITIGHQKLDDVFVIGHWHLDRDLGFDKSFYRAAKVPFECRWDSFYVERDKASEVKPIAKPFIFVHDDAPRGMGIHGDTLPTGVHFRPDTAKSPNIFGWMGVLEAAQEIHVIESAFAFLVDSFVWDKPLVIHRYARHLSHGERPTYRNAWRIIE